MSQNGESTTPRDKVMEEARNSPSPDRLHTEPTSHQAEHSPSATTPDADADVPNAEADIDPTALTNGATQKASNEMTNGTPDHSNRNQEQLEEEQVDEDTPMEDQAMTSKAALEDYDWQELEDRFAAKMIECQKKEEELGKEFAQWLEVFKAWASVTEVHEEDRARKRLRTRITYVQIKEQDLEKKRNHYIKVVNAFESALALLNDA